MPKHHTNQNVVGLHDATNGDMIISSPPSHDCNRENAHAGHMQGVSCGEGAVHGARSFRAPGSTKVLCAQRCHAWSTCARLPIFTPQSAGSECTMHSIMCARDESVEDGGEGGWKRGGEGRGDASGVCAEVGIEVCAGEGGCRRDCLRLQWRPKMIQRSGRSGDDDTIDGSELNQQPTNDVNWRCGGATGRRHDEGQGHAHNNQIDHAVGR